MRLCSKIDPEEAIFVSLLLNHSLIGRSYSFATLANLFLYSIGVSPVIFLKISLNALVSVYPTPYITSVTFFRDASKNFFAASILTRCRYSIGVLVVASLNLLSKVL